MSQNSSSASKPVGPTVLYGLGVLLILIGVIKGAVGFYQSDLPWMISVLLGGALCAAIAKKWGERA